jgi:hypothetical protein
MFTDAVKSAVKTIPELFALMMEAIKILPIYY